MLLAAIDIGSNAVRLLFSNVIEHNGQTVADKASFVRIPIRLGDDAFKLGYITEARADNLVKTLTAFKLLIDVNKPLHYRACATAAMREATNSAQIIERIFRETGLVVEVIDGLEEARIVASVNNTSKGKQYKFKMYIDVGGGSTEVTLTRDNQVIRSESFQIGTIRLRDNAVKENEWDRLKDWLKPLRDEEGRIFCIGSGGNINKISKLYAKAESGTVFYNELEKAYDTLSSVSLDYRISEMGMRPDRADVIVPAAEIFLKIMKWARVEFIFVPKAGLADGLINLLYKEK